jgi:hypothetical protein
MMQLRSKEVPTEPSVDANRKQKEWNTSNISKLVNSYVCM